MKTEKLDAKAMAVFLTQEGFMRWAEGKAITILDVKTEWRESLMSNFVGRTA